MRGCLAGIALSIAASLPAAAAAAAVQAGTKIRAPRHARLPAFAAPVRLRSRRQDCSGASMQANAGGEGAKRFAPAAERNTAPILGVLKGIMPPGGRVLAIAEGSGQHVAAFAQTFTDAVFVPTEANPDCLASISAYVADAGLNNVLRPVVCDCTNPDMAAMGEDAFDLVYAINLTHISPWVQCECSRALVPFHCQTEGGR